MFKKHIKLITLFSLPFCSNVLTPSDTSFWLPQKPSLRFHNNEPIFLKPGAYEQLVERWNNRLQRSWDNFYARLQNDIGTPKEIFYRYLYDKTITQHYNSLKEKDLSTLKDTEYTSEEDIDPEVLTFIKKIIKKHCSKKNIKILLTPHINTLTATFGSDKGTHYLICNSAVYAKEHIKQYYDSLTTNNGTFYIEHLATSVRSIELSNFLIIGLIEAASHIQHQSNLFTFLVANFKFSDKKPSEATIQFGWYIAEVRGILEAVLQSKNPLETAIFIGKTRKRNEKERKLWKKLIHELADCYNEESLEYFKASIREINQLYKP